MDDQMLQTLAQVFMQVMAQQGQEISPEQAVQRVSQLASAAQQGDEQATQMLQQLVQVAQQMGQLQQAVAARHGAKLNYVRLLNNIAPEGYEINYYKCGGTMKKKIKKSQNGTPLGNGVRNIGNWIANKGDQFNNYVNKRSEQTRALAERNRQSMQQQRAAAEARRNQQQAAKKAEHDRNVQIGLERQRKTNERNARIKAELEAARLRRQAADAARAKQRQLNSQARQAARSQASSNFKQAAKDYYNNTSIGRMFHWDKNGGTIPYYVKKQAQKFV